MGSAVAADGSLAMQCQSCHGTMSAVGAPTRTGWLDEPTCQNCHTGTATQQQRADPLHLGVRRARRSAASPANAHLRDQRRTRPLPGFDLYRFSTGHGGLKCESCHGSTHAEFPSSHANDNLQSIALQGHAGALRRVHELPRARVPSTVTGGPHGMHPVGQVWVQRSPRLVGEGGAARAVPRRATAPTTAAPCSRARRPIAC